MTRQTPHTHLDTADLVRIVDGQLDADEQRTAEQALEQCVVCRTGARRVHDRTTRLSAVLADADWTPPARALADIRGGHAAAAASRAAGRRARVRIAAGIAVLLIGAALVTTPAAAWLARTAASAWSAITNGAESTPPAAAPGDAAASQHAFDYVPDAGELTLRIAATARGSVRLESAAGDRLTLHILRADAPEVLLLPREVRIAGVSSAAATHRVRVPRQVTAVRVVIDGSEPVVYPRGRIDEGVTIAREP
jgi:hypothetical protein